MRARGRYESTTITIITRAHRSTCASRSGTAPTWECCHCHFYCHLYCQHHHHHHHHHR